MSLNLKSARRSAVAIAAGTALLLGAAACSENQDTQTTQEKANDAATKATDAAGDALEDAKDSASEAADSLKDKASEAKDKAGDAFEDAKDSASEAADDLKGKADELKASGATVSSADQLPENVKDIADEHSSELGGFKKFSQDDNASLATFDNGWIATGEDNDPVVLVGKIGETWVNDGGLDNELGLPTAPESGNPEDGWTQDFENGTMTWAKNEESGKYEADIHMN